MRKSSRRVLEVAMLAALVYSGPTYAQTASPNGGPAKIVKICDKTDGISARIGRTFKETAAIFGKTTTTCGQSARARCPPQ